MTSFRVIIAGGSLAGLTLALCLEHAGIDYVLFEKGEIAPQLGASIGLHPHSLRILEQLGVWKDLEKGVVPLLYRRHFDAHGRCFEDSQVLKEIYQRANRPIIFMERCEALRILYSHIKNKSNIHSKTAVVSYKEMEKGVSITTSRSDIFEGSVLVGADGIHSVVRALMAQEVLTTQPELGRELHKGFTAEYKCIFATSRNISPRDPASPMMPDAVVHNVYYDYYSAVAATGVPGLIFWFFFVKMPSVTKTPDCPRFTDEDMQSVIDEYGQSQVGPGYTIKNLWDTRVKAQLVPLEEGVLKKWNHGRVVLVGDAIHKATINPGLGGNLAYEGVVRLVNGLYDLLQRSPQPTVAELSTVFQTVEKTHRPRAEFTVKFSGMVTRYEAQDSWYLKLASRWVIPYISDARKADMYVEFSNKGPKLDFLPDPNTQSGK